MCFRFLCRSCRCRCRRRSSTARRPPQLQTSPSCVTSADTNMQHWSHVLCFILITASSMCWHTTSGWRRTPRSNIDSQHLLLKDFLWICRSHFSISLISVQSFRRGSRWIGGGMIYPSCISTKIQRTKMTFIYSIMLVSFCAFCSPVSQRALEGIGKCRPADAPPSPSHPTTAGGGTLTGEMWFAGRWLDSDGWPVGAPPSSCQHSDWGRNQKRMSFNGIKLN